MLVWCDKKKRREQAQTTEFQLEFCRKFHREVDLWVYSARVDAGGVVHQHTSIDQTRSLESFAPHRPNKSAKDLESSRRTI